MPEELNPAEVAKIDELVQYQKGSIVSRTLLEKPAGDVTIFAFDEGQGLREHSAPYDALVQVIDGQAEISISGQAYKLSSGQMILMPANKPHAVKAVKRFKMILTMVHE
jgi:quercetin dioxygenase-like cupin family protein